MQNSKFPISQNESMGNNLRTLTKLKTNEMENKYKVVSFTPKKQSSTISVDNIYDYSLYFS